MNKRIAYLYNEPLPQNIFVTIDDFTDEYTAKKILNPQLVCFLVIDMPVSIKEGILEIYFFVKRFQPHTKTEPRVETRGEPKLTAYEKLLNA